MKSGKGGMLEYWEYFAKTIVMIPLFQLSGFPEEIKTVSIKDNHFDTARI
jgi:hypothetical protein